MNLYIVETRNFDFKCFAEDDVQFKVFMTKAWTKHCQEYGIKFDQEFLNEITEYPNTLEVKSGVYRDNQFLK